MRTDTTTFAKFVFRAVRDLGINSVRSKQVARRISSSFSYGFHNPYGDFSFEARKNIDTIELQLNIGFSGFQGVDVIIDGEFGFRASTNDGVLVDVEATPRQVEMCDELHDLMRATNTAISNACDAFAKEFGYPQTNEDCEKRFEFCEQDSGIIAAQAHYDALRDESLAINRFAPGHYIDPALHYEYSDTYKYEYGCRPRGYTSVAEMKAYLEREHRDFDKQFDVQEAA